MTNTVTLHPSGHQFDAPPDKTLLQAALEAGFSLPYSCRAGHCGTCRGRTLRGRVRADDSVTGLDARQKAAGYILLCKSYSAESDVTIDIQEAEVTLTPPKIIPCRIKSVERPIDTVAVVKLRLPMNENVVFLPGQFVEFLLEDGQTRSYSIANPPKKNGVVEMELHIRHRPGGRFTDPLFNADMVGKVMRIQAPLGSFHLREDSDKPIICLATGTGFAPIKSIIQHAHETGSKRRIFLYWGGRSPDDFYMRGLIQQWEEEHGNFSFIPIVSRAGASDWAGRTGYVHQAVKADFPNLSNYQVYACGAPSMVAAARKELIEDNQLDESDFFSDAFIPSDQS